MREFKKERSNCAFPLSNSPKHKHAFLLLLFLMAFPRCLLAFAASQQNNRPIPITVLSGFLGSGKTTLLQNILSNDQGLRIAVVVNDVASVNIDSKLVSSTRNAAAGMVELQNGCACCSKSEELLASVAELITLNDLRGEDEGFHHIVVEMSGVADPKSVRANFQEAALYSMPLMERVELDTMVTLVDCATFEHYLRSDKTASPDESPELFFRDDEEPPEVDENFPKDLFDQIYAGSGRGSNQEGGVAELLISQAEVADVVLLNKEDLVDNKQSIARIEAIVRTINPRAKLMRSQYGDVPLESVLGAARGTGVVLAGLVDDHKDAVQAAISEPHSHDYEHVNTMTKDEIHSTAHDHSHTHNSLEDDAHSRSNTHAHSHDHTSECDDPNCTDPSHSHNHSHEAHAGIGAFVYQARRPFHPRRVVSFLRHLPVLRGLPDSGSRENTSDEEIEIDGATRAVLQQIIRSKGFTWFGDSNIAALYWSQAGSSFELSTLGSWWATLDRARWPPDVTASILADFDHVDHNEGALDLRVSVGDRRQELVFIGPQMGGASNQALVRGVLDQCLLTDSEWDIYCNACQEGKPTQEQFSNPFSANVVRL